MKFVVKDMGKAADISAGDGSQILELTKLLSYAMILILTIFFSTKYLGEYLISNISIENEKQWLGKLNIFSLSHNNSTKNTKQAEEILAKLVLNSNVPDLDYKIIVIDEDMINAFAFPGGTIGLTKGLLEKLENEQALAFVIAHELGHFKYRHHLVGFSRAISTGIIFSLVFGNQPDLIITQNILTLLNRSYSQQQELDSDAYSAKLVFDTYDTTNNIDQLLKIMESEEDERLLVDFLSTHPSFNSRIDHLKNISMKLNSDTSK